MDRRPRAAVSKEVGGGGDGLRENEERSRRIVSTGAASMSCFVASGSSARRASGSRSRGTADLRRRLEGGRCRRRRL